MKRITNRRNYGDARKILRERLVRFLPVFSNNGILPKDKVPPVISDQELVQLLLRLNVIPGDDIEIARATYTEARALQLNAEALREGSSSAEHQETQAVAGSITPNAIDEGGVSISISISGPNHSFEGLSPPPSFDELIDRGWIVSSWGRYDIPRYISTAVNQSEDARANAFRSIVSGGPDTTYKFCSEKDLVGRVKEVADSISNRTVSVRSIGCLSAPWVAARLWDTHDAFPADISNREMLSIWLDRWLLLGAPPFAPSSYLDAASFEKMESSIVEVLEESSTTPGWERFSEEVTAPYRLLRPQGTEPILLDSAPATVIERHLWLSRGMPQLTFHDHFGLRASYLMALALNEIEYAQFDGNNFGSSLMRLAVNRPVLLAQLVMRVRNSPVVLATMLLCKDTCTLACSLIANWEYNDGGWFREFQASGNRATVLLGFEDALAILGGHLDDAAISPAETAALYRDIFKGIASPQKMARAGELLSLLREELANANSAHFDEAVTYLIAATSHESNPVESFGAALDMLTDSGSAERMEPNRIVATYLDYIFMYGARITGGELGLQASQVLCGLAMRAEKEVRQRFLNAIDVRTWLADEPQEETAQYLFSDKSRRRIRLHIRILSRAIAAWPSAVPNELVEALACAIDTGSTENPNRGRIDVFVPSIVFGQSWNQENSIENDLVAALMRLQGDARQKILTQLCHVDEPTVLAGIVAGTPAVIHQEVKQHLSRMTPDSVPTVWNLPSGQARVEALLGAGLVEVAAPFIEAQQAAKTYGNVPGRGTTNLRTELRLMLLREQWDAIAAYVLPESVPHSEVQEQQDTLLFYRAVAALLNPAGNADLAEKSFADLMRRHPSITVYALNVFGSRVRRLLNTDSLELLQGERLAQAKRYLAEAARDIRPKLQHDSKDLKMLDFNRAILHLAAGQPNESLQLLMALRDGYPIESVEGIRAVAVARLGAISEAKAVLSEAEKHFGRTKFLTGIRENIDTHRPFLTAPNLVIDDNPVSTLRHAIAAFHRLGHVEQAQILHSYGEFDGYLTEQIRESCSGLVSLVPMMKSLGLTTLEDDISGVLKQLLRSRLAFTQWAVEDQPRGGYSEKNGVGERDFCITKGAVELAVIEAVVVDSVRTSTLTLHFKKLFAYSQCLLFFHVTYVWGSNCKGVLDHLKRTCSSPPDEAIRYLGAEDLPDNDSKPVGFAARYSVNGRGVRVVFLALDIGQKVQRAAAASQKSKPKRSRKEK